MKNGPENFEQKKVQCVKGSFYVYLPKDWALKYNIDDNKRVLLKRLDDDSILIRSTEQQKLERQSYEIDLDFEVMAEKPEFKEVTKDVYFKYILNLYLTAYIIGYNRIVFTTHRSKIPMKVQNRITAMTRTLYGMVIVSETKDHIVVEDTSSIFDMKLMMRQVINKVGLCISNFIELIDQYGEIRGNRDEMNETLEDFIKQDDQIDEHRYAIERYAHQILKYPTLGHDSGISSVECLHNSECTRMLERIGDYMIKLAVLLKKQAIHDVSFVLKHLRTMEEVFHVVQDNFDRNHPLKFYQLIQEIKVNADETKELIENQDPDAEFLIPIRRIKNICADIAEIRINDTLSRNNASK